MLCNFCPPGMNIMRFLIFSRCLLDPFDNISHSIMHSNKSIICLPHQVRNFELMNFSIAMLFLTISISLSLLSGMLLYLWMTLDHKCLIKRCWWCPCGYSIYGEWKTIEHYLWKAFHTFAFWTVGIILFFGTHRATSMATPSRSVIVKEFFVDWYIFFVWIMENLFL